MKLAAFIFGAQTIQLMINLYAKKYIADDKASTLNELEKDFGIPRIKTFDYIVVGGGSAGCIMAGRLSEKFNVLLLEAGGKPVPQAHSPWFTRFVATDPDTNFIYKTVPQQNFSLSTGGIVTIDSGKMLGGSGSHNDMIHQRGSPLDWDNLAQVSNDPSWRYENVLQYYKKSEDFIGDLMQPDQSDYYGQGGPLTVDTFRPAFSPKWFEAGVELGFPIADPNALQIESFAPLWMLWDKGGRVSTYNRYVLPYEEIRANLTVVKYSTVTKILLDKTNTAYGVTYLRHGIPQIAHASKEVVLSAGAINSPLILMMSGIGPADVLAESGIDVKVESPLVGQNLADHVLLNLDGFTWNASALPYLPRVPEDMLEEDLQEYLETGVDKFGELQEGPQAFYVSSRAKSEFEGTWPDAHFGIETSCPKSLDDDVATTSCHYLFLDRPKSRGSLRLNSTAYMSGSTDFVELAEIDFKYFTVPSDLDVVIETIDLIFKIVETTRAYQSLGATYSAPPVPGCTGVPFKSREYWVCYTQQMATTGIHMVGTNAMGASFNSVVDSSLRVRGVTNLRVVDASVFPAAPNANINGPIIALSEKIADDMLNQL